MQKYVFYEYVVYFQVVFIGMFSGSNIWGVGADKYGRLAVSVIRSLLLNNLLVTHGDNSLMDSALSIDSIFSQSLSLSRQVLRSLGVCAWRGEGEEREKGKKCDLW